MAENNSSNRLKRTADYLIDTSQIGCIRGHADKHPRYINLRSQDMFDNLVNMYACLFKTQWQHYSTFLDFFHLPTGVPPQIYAARCYISFWFVDLYVSNRKAVKEFFWSASLLDFYHGELTSLTQKYDHYLVLLNASIRPTYLKHNLDNALYIPVISNSLDVDSENPFGINNFALKFDIFLGLTEIMTKQNWHFTQLAASDTMGRPWWLFDWHSKNRVCSWFSQEGNYDLEDVTLAYILGTACTSNLGPRDDDDWQYLNAEGVAPDNPDPMSYDRVVERRFYGSYEVRTIEIDTDFSLSTAARKRLPGELGSICETSAEQAQEGNPLIMPRFKLIDWVYSHQVIMKMDIHLRVRILRSMSFKSFQDFI